MTAKKCTKCGIDQPLQNFPPRKSRKDGRCSHCHACNRGKTKLWKEANPERALALSRERFANNRDAANAGRAARYVEAMKDHEKRAKHNKSSGQWRLNHPDRAAKNASDWCRNNPDLNTARASRYRASKLMATPAWVEPDDLLPAYREARAKTVETGILHHVDHIVPLKGKTVCGLHVPWNLRAIPAIENISKGAKLIEEACLA